MVLDGPGCKLIRREPLEARVRSVVVEVITPFGNQLTCVAEGTERRLGQQLIAQPTDEARGERVLDRLARRNVVPGYVRLLLPAQHRQRRELRSILSLTTVLARPRAAIWTQ